MRALPAPYKMPLKMLRALGRPSSAAVACSLPVAWVNALVRGCEFPAPLHLDFNELTVFHANPLVVGFNTVEFILQNFLLGFKNLQFFFVLLVSYAILPDTG